MTNTILYDTSNHPINLGKSYLTCFVLENRQKVFTIFSLQKALGYDGKFENWLLEFLSEISHESVNKNQELIKLLENPIKINGFEKNSTTTNTIECQYILPICEAIIEEKNKDFFNKSQLKIYNKAYQIVEFLKTKSIDEFIDESIGYKIYKENILEKSIKILEKNHNNSAFIWVKTFPHSFIEMILEMNELSWNNIKQNPELIGNLTYEILFSRIDDALLNDLSNHKPKRSYKGKNNTKQELEHPKLKEHLAVLNSLAVISSNNWIIFLQLLNKTLPIQKERSQINFTTTNYKKETEFSNFNEKLIRSLKFIKK